MSSGEFKALSIALSAVINSLDDKQKKNFNESFGLIQKEVFLKLNQTESEELGKARNQFLDILENR